MSKFSIRSCQNSPDTFPNINLPILKIIAERWVKIYLKIPITRITLYTYTTTTSRFAKCLKGKIDTRYAIVFEYSDTEDKEAIEELKELRADTEAGSLNDPFQRLIPAYFICVYKNQPTTDDYLNEWIFLQYTEEQWELLKADKCEIAELGIMIDEPCWVLFINLGIQVMIPSLNAKKESSYDKHRRECRKKAIELWADDPTITIVAMCRREDIISLFEGKGYDARSFRRMVKDLCPNHNPGRRPSEKNLPT